MTSIERMEYGTLPDGRVVTQYVLRSDRGVVVKLLDYGAIVSAVETPDRDGAFADIAYGCDALADWVADTHYMGGTIGRFANRIAGARVEIDGASVELSRNEADNHLHGGHLGFHKQLWSGEPIDGGNGDAGIRLTRVSLDGEEGYPGELNISATHWLTADGRLRIEYEATTTKPTVINLTHHSYWNLSGGRRADVLDHLLQVDADAYTPVGSSNVPTGEIASVANTPLDFTASRLIGEHIKDLPNGYDHNFVLRGGKSTLRRAARLIDPTSGRTLELFTDAPGMQVYSSNFFDGTTPGKRGIRHEKYCSVAIEAQNFPDAPHHDAFPNAILRPGETYRRTIEFHFGTDA